MIVSASNNNQNIYSSNTNNKEFQKKNSFMGRNVSNINIENKSKLQRLKKFIQKKYLRSLSSYKMYNTTRKISQLITKTIIFILDFILSFFKIETLLRAIFRSYTPNHGARKFLLTENEIWGIAPKSSLQPTEKEAEHITEDLLKTFKDEKTAYLLIFQGLDKAHQHASIFIGASSDETTNKIKFANWNNNKAGKRRYYSLKKEIMLHGTPDVIAIPNLDTQAMKERWKWFVNSDMKYSMFVANCCHIVNDIINWGLGIKNKPVNNKLLFSPEELKKRGLKLKLAKTNTRYDKNEISPPLLVRRIHLKNQEQFMEDYKVNPNNPVFKKT